LFRNYIRCISIVIEPYAIELTDRNHYQIDDYEIMLQNISTNEDKLYVHDYSIGGERCPGRKDGAAIVTSEQGWRKVIEEKGSGAEGILVINKIVYFLF
jgi:hypothetical protein